MGVVMGVASAERGDAHGRPRADVYPVAIIMKQIMHGRKIQKSIIIFFLNVQTDTHTQTDIQKDYCNPPATLGLITGL